MKTSTIRFRAIIAAIMMLMVTLPSFAYDFEVNDIFYNILDVTTKDVEVTSGDNYYSGSITIPSSVKFNGKSYSGCRSVRIRGMQSFCFY